MAGRKSILNLPVIREKVITKGRLSDVVLLDPVDNDVVFATKVNGKLMSSGTSRVSGDVVKRILALNLTDQDFEIAKALTATDAE